MQALRLYLIDVGYGRGFVGPCGQATTIDQAQEYPWDAALHVVHNLRRRGYVGAEAVPVTITPEPSCLTETCDANGT